MRLPLVCYAFLLLCSGCAAVFPPAASGPLQQPVADLGEQQLFAVHPNGDLLAYVNQGLELLRLSDGYRQRLLFDAPDAIIWSADGRQLVAAVREGEQTRLVQLTAAAETRRQVVVAEQVTDLAWQADGRLLALAQIVTEDETAVQVQLLLLFWDGGRPVERQPLYRFSYPQPAAAERLTAARLEHRFDLSPLKDELLYNRYLGSPDADGKLELVLYHLQTGREQVLAVMDNRQPEALWTADAEHLLLPQADEVVWLNPWTRQVAGRWSGSGQALQVAAGRNLFLMDGQLLAGNSLLQRLPADVRGQFSADGERLFVAREQKLYLLAGYPVPEKLTYSTLERLRLLTLRLQRSRGELSVSEYYQARQNILQP